MTTTEPVRVRCRHDGRNFTPDLLYAVADDIGGRITIRPGNYDHEGPDLEVLANGRPLSFESDRASLLAANGWEITSRRWGHDCDWRPVHGHVWRATVARTGTTRTPKDESAAAIAMSK